MTLPNIVTRLTRELGAHRVIASDSDKLATYATDQSPLQGYTPDCAVVCDHVDQVIATLAIAQEDNIPVTPRGAGSGKTGGCLAVRGGVVLSCEGMTKTLDIDTKDFVCVVEPGVVTGQLQTAVEAQGLFYPPDPASLAYCSIGGNVACNAGGPRALKYGVTREYVLGLDVVLMGGEHLQIGRRTSKGVTGYDLVAGFVGSEGTFGVITKVVLKLLPKPRAYRTFVAHFPTLLAASTTVTRLLNLGFRPRTLEIADAVCVHHLAHSFPAAFLPKSGAMIWVEIDGEPELLETTMLRCATVCETMGATDVIIATDVSQSQAMWQARRNISGSLRSQHRHRVSEDIAVPLGNISQMIETIDTISAGCGLLSATFGHAGDGNLHVSFMTDEDPAQPAVQQTIRKALTSLFTKTVALGGTLSGEHGIGLTKRDYMPLEIDHRVLAWQKKWKQMWDPKELLNPGKILPSNTLCHE